MNEVPRYGVNSPRFFQILLRMREEPPPKEWYQKAVQEVKQVEAQATEARFIETSWGWRLTR